MISDNIRGTAAVAALASLAMLASAGVASAAAIGTPIAVDKTNTFTADETVDLLGGDLGEAANFGLVGFDSIHLNAHTNSNIATEHAYIGAAFGNHAAGVDEPEVSYLGKVDGSINVSLPRRLQDRLRRVHRHRPDRQRRQLDGERQQTGNADRRKPAEIRTGAQGLQGQIP